MELDKIVARFAEGLVVIDRLPLPPTRNRRTHESYLQGYVFAWEVSY